MSFFDGVLEYEEVVYEDTDCLTLGNVGFKKDFGAFKAGDKVSHLQINWEDGALVEFDDCKELRKQSFTLVPR